LLKNIQFRTQLSSVTRGQEAGYRDTEERGCKPGTWWAAVSKGLQQQQNPTILPLMLMKSNKLTSQATPPLQVNAEK